MNVADKYERIFAEFSDIQCHMPTLRDYAAQSQQVIEIGVGSCRSTVSFLVGIEESGGHLWSVEIDPTPVPEWLREHPQWTLVVGDSLDHHEAAPHDVDVLFIDSDHSFEQTFAELNAYVPHVRSGGVVLLHDTGGHQPGVKKAIDLFCDPRGWEWEDDPNSYGLGTIRIP